MISSLLVVGWVAYNFRKNRRQPIFFHSPADCFTATSAPPSRVRFAHLLALYGIGAGGATIEKKGGDKKWIQSFFACLQRGTECRVCLTALNRLAMWRRVVKVCVTYAGGRSQTKRAEQGRIV